MAKSEIKKVTNLKWDLVIKISSYALAFLAPLFFLPWGIYKVSFNKQYVVLILALVAFFSYLAKSLHAGKLIYKKDTAIILGFLFIAFISLIFSINTNTSLFGATGAEIDSFINILSFTLIFLSISGALGKENIKKLLSIYFISIGILLVFQLLQLFKIFILPLGFTKFIDFNPIATVYDLTFFFGANLTLALSVIFSNAEIEKPKKILLSILALGLFIYLLLINYSLVWIFLTISIIPILISNLAFQHENKRKQNFLIVLVAIFVFLSFSNLNLIRMPRFFRFNIPPAVSLNPSSSIKIIKNVYLNKNAGIISNVKNILLGSGPATFGYDYLKFKPKELNLDIFLGAQKISDFWKIRFNTASSPLLTYLATLGILAVILLLLFSVNLIRKSFKTPYLSIFIFLLLALIFYNPNYLLILMFFVSAAIFKAREENLELNIFTSPQRQFMLSFLILILMIGSLISIYYENQRFAASIYYDLGLRAASAGNLDAAVLKIGKAISWDNRSTEYYRGLSNIALGKFASASSMQDDFQNARAASQTAINLNAIDSLNYTNIAQIYETVMALISNVQKLSDEQKTTLTNTYNLAVANYKKAAELDPKNPEIHLNLARLHLIMNNSEEAEKSLKTALDLKPDYSDAYLALAQVFEKNGKLDEAIANAKNAKTVNPNDLGTLFQLGIFYYRNEQLDSAQSELENALFLSPNYSNARYFLGLVYDKKGMKDKAMEQFEKVKELNPDNAEIKKILENLRAGKSALAEPEEPKPEKKK